VIGWRQLGRPIRAALPIAHAGDTPSAGAGEGGDFSQSFVILVITCKLGECRINDTPKSHSAGARFV